MVLAGAPSRYLHIATMPMVDETPVHRRRQLNASSAPRLRLIEADRRSAVPSLHQGWSRRTF
jgi:hypothetical protein